MSQAEQLRTQAAAVESQGHAFSAAGSVLFAVVNGYIDLEEKRIREMQERAAAEAPKESEVVKPQAKKRGRPKKVSEPAVDALAPTPEVGSDAPDEG
jgi:hypothetical protein